MNQVSDENNLSNTDRRFSNVDKLSIKHPQVEY